MQICNLLVLHVGPLLELLDLELVGGPVLLECLKVLPEFQLHGLACLGIL